MRTIRIMALVCAATMATSAQGQTRKVYVTAFDASGAVYTELGPADFVVKEGGKERPVISLGPPATKMQIAILVDDNGTGIFRVGVARFIEALLGRADFSVSAVTGQTMKLVDYTSDPGPLSDAVARIGARPTTQETQLLDGIVGVARDMQKRKLARPVIVALTAGGTDVTPMQPEDALSELRKSGAQLYVVSTLTRGAATPSRPGDMLNEGHALAAVLGDGPRRSGGDRVEISAIAGVDTGLNRFAQQLKRQLVLEYSLEGAKPSDRVSIGLKRSDLTLHAPTHVPNKF
jgi:hypothetical protein